MNLQAGLKCLFDATKDRHEYFRWIDCIEKLCKKLKDYARGIINYQKKEMIPLKDEETKFYEEQEVCHICKTEFCFDKNNKKGIKKTP